MVATAGLRLLLCKPARWFRRGQFLVGDGICTLYPHHCPTLLYWSLWWLLCRTEVRPGKAVKTVCSHQLSKLCSELIYLAEAHGDGLCAGPYLKHSKYLGTKG